MRINQRTTTILISLFLGIMNYVRAQNTEPVILFPKTVTTSSVEYDESWQEGRLLQLVLNNEFSRLITGNSLAGLGNYASISTANNTLDANGSIIGNQKIYAFKISAGLSDDIATIFSNGRLNSNVGLGLTFHRLFSNPKIALKTSDISKFNDETKKIAESHKKKYAEILNFEVNSQESINKKQKEIDDLVKKKSLLDSLLSRKKKLKEKRFKLDSLKKSLDVKIKKYKDTISTIRNRKNRRASQIGRDQLRLTFLIEALRESTTTTELVTKQIKEKEKEWKSLIKEEKQKNHLAKLYEAKIQGLQNDVLKLSNELRNHSRAKKIHTSRNNTIETLRTHMTKINDIKATDISIEWLSLGVEANYQTFNLFDETREFND